jgi:eukaryotic-like serine/threonine-protein kinase
MKTEDWRKVKEIVIDALEVDRAARRDFIEKHCADSPEIKREVESLLESENESEAEKFLEFPAVINYAGLLDFGEEEAEALAGQTIGNYRIIREIGRGGMGAVYLAERADGNFEQKVAIKLLKRELNTKILRRRFRHERQILAALQHPSIARLLDAGTTEDGVPFLAMEYVEGAPIDVFCDQQNYDLPQRLKLFRQVCEAVAFAHRNLVIHRDLKPSNILVTKDGAPKLLDFGIAKLLTPEDGAAGEQTVTQFGAMTPSYASPEQLRMEKVSTTTDVYSLGVILYELLSGHRPFELFERNLQEVIKAVCETEPQPPSTAARLRTGEKKYKPDDTTIKSEDGFLPFPRRKTAENKTAAQDFRHTNPQVVSFNSQLLKGDLDNIVLKALKKEPERRYSSVEFFSEDVRRYLEGLPVAARPDTFSYRAEKFIKRNRAGVFAGALILIAIIGGAVATFWQATIARAERIRAEKRFNDVRALANSFLLEFSPLIENLPGSVPARELLVKRALEYLDNLSREAGDDWQLRSELATAYQKVGDVQGNPFNPNLGDTKGALDSYEKSLAIRQILSDREPDNIKLREDLATVNKRIGDIHSLGGDYEKASGFYDKALELREKIVAENPQNFEARASLAEMLRARGLIPFYDGDNKKAIEYYARARDLNEQLRREQPENAKVNEQYAYSFVAIGEAQGWDNDLQGAAKNLQTGLEMLTQLAEKYPNDLSIQRSLQLAYIKRAEVHQDLKEFDKSVEVFRKALEAAEKSLRADPQSFQARRDVAMCNKKLAQALDDAGKSRESLEKLAAALKMFQEMSAADPKNTEYPYDVANTRFSIGETYLTLKNYDSALETFLKAKEEFQTVMDKSPENIYAVRMSSFNLEGIGKCYEALSAGKNQRELLPKALENFRGAFNNLNKLKGEGKLAEFDFKALDEMAKKIKDLEVKTKQ